MGPASSRAHESPSCKFTCEVYCGGRRAMIAEVYISKQANKDLRSVPQVNNHDY